MGNVINKQGFFIVKMAQNIEKMPAERRVEALSRLDPKIKMLVSQAMNLLSKKRLEG